MKRAPTFALALYCAACSNEFRVLSERPSGAGGVEPTRDAGERVDAALQDAAADARVQDAAGPEDATVQPPEGPLANAVSGFKHTCAVVQGALYCWGWDAFGQVGVPGDRDQRKPIKLSDDPFSEVCAGERHSCALRVDGALFCWGGNAYGELGTGDLNSRETLTRIDAQPFVALACGGVNTCAIAARGELWCWGDNSEGKLGQDDPSPGVMGTLAFSERPIRVRTDERFVQVSVGQGHVCALSEQGKAYCWGRNSAGQLGIAGTPEQTRTPLPVVGDATFSTLAAGQTHSCAVDVAGQLACWGSTVDGLLGVPTDQVQLRTPTRLDGEGYDYVTANWFHSCAHKKDDTLVCWGRGLEGQLGLGDYLNRDRPTQVDGRWSVVSAGNFHSCAFADDGLYCWGANDTAQLGLGDDARRPVPFKVTL